MTLVMALFQKQVNCPSDKAITMCGTTDRAMRLMPVRHNRIGTFAENKLRLVPTTMCRRTLYMPDYKNEPAGIKQLMPWSEFIKENCSGITDTEKILPENRGDLPI